MYIQNSVQFDISAHSVQSYTEVCGKNARGKIAIGKNVRGKIAIGKHVRAKVVKIP